MSVGHFVLIAVVVLAALAFDFINGFHDAANSIATIVSTRVLTPFRAVLWAAFFNFIAFALFKLHVASTIGKGIIDPAVVDMAVIIGALPGPSREPAHWWWGLPSSSSHALVGGLIGAGVSKAGLGILGWGKIGATAAFILISPLLGYLGASILMIGCSWLLRRQTPGRVDRWFSRLQFLSASASASTTAATTPRRPWESSPCCCTHRGCWARPFPARRTSRCGSFSRATRPWDSAPWRPVGES